MNFFKILKSNKQLIIKSPNFAHNYNNLKLLTGKYQTLHLKKSITTHSLPHSHHDKKDNFQFHSQPSTIKNLIIFIILKFSIIITTITN